MNQIHWYAFSSAKMIEMLITIQAMTSMYKVEVVDP